MLKSVFFAFTLVVIAAVHAKPEPPAAEVHTHHYHTHTTTVKHHPQKQQKHGKQPRERSQQEQPHWQQYNQGEQQQQQQVKVRQSGPSKIFGWLGSRFAKIPHYLPRFPQFPKNPSPQKQQHQNQHQQPSYHAIILPDPPKPAGHGKVKSPQKVKLTQVTEVYEQPQVSPYLEVAANSAVQHNTYAPLPVSVTSYTVPNTAQQIEVVPSTLLYSDKQVFHPQQQQQQQYQSSNPIAQYKQIAPAPAPIAAPPLQYTQYSVPQVSYNALPAPVQKPQVFAAQGYKQPQAGTVPVVPQSTGPDYFDTAYRGATEQQVGYQIVSAKQQEQQQQQQQQQVLLSPENNYGATYEIQSQSVPQVYDSSVNLGAIGGPVISSTSQQASYSSAPAQTYTSIQQYANQALSSQQLSALSSSIADSGAVNQEQNIYAQYSQLAPSVAQAPVQGQDASQQGQSAGGQQQYVYQYQTQEAAESQNQPQLSDTPGVQILSQSSDGGNPVFEVIADANAPDYNGHPFDINKLISMIEPGAQLESAELSHAASETKTTYMAPASGSTSSSSSSSSSSATSGINDLIISESAPAPSVVANVNGSKLSHAPSSSSSSLPLNLNGNSKLNNSSSSSYKEIMDFFQQTGGKGYILVEKKRQRDPHSDNLTLDSDANRDDDLTNEGPTRLNITSDSFFLPQLNLLEQGGRPLTNNSKAKSESSNNIPTDLLFPLDSPDFEENSEIDEYDTSINNRQANVNNESVQKHINSFNVNHIPSHSDKRQNSNSKTVQTTAPTVSTGSNVAVAESSINNSTTTDRPSSVDHPVTQVTQLTTLFEPVTPGKPVIFATTPSATLNGSTFHPHHNYYAHTSPRPSPQYPSFIPLPQRGGSAPTLNSFLDSIDESLLLGEDDPIETEGDLNASESQQVRSIAITVTPPPSLVSTTPAGKPSKHKSTLTVTTARTTTTEKPVSPITINPAFLVPVTKKATADASKRRPAPVYMGNKKTTQAPLAAV